MEGARLVVKQSGVGGDGWGVRALPASRSSTLRGGDDESLRLCMVKGAAFRRSEPFLVTSR